VGGADASVVVLVVAGFVVRVVAVPAGRGDEVCVAAGDEADGSWDVVGKLSSVLSSVGSLRDTCCCS